MAVPKFLQSSLASYDLSRVDVKKDKEIIVTEILNKGDGKDLDWLAKTYTKDEIKLIVSKPMRGSWMESVLRYWINVFGIKISEKVFRGAVLDLNP